MSQVLWLLSRIDPLNLVDILLVALLFYGLLTLLQGTRAVPLMRGLIIVLLLVLIIRSLFSLPTLGWLLDNALPALLVTIPVVFQPELRRALENLGHTIPRARRSWSSTAAQEMRQVLDELDKAGSEL